MGTFGQRLLRALQDLFASKKVIMVLAGFGATLLARRGIVLQPDDITQILVAMGIAVGGQAAADVGKSAAAIKAANPPPADTVQQINVSPKE